MSEQDPPHRCHARGCEREVRPVMLMCFSHWRRIPKPIQSAVWAAYRPGQCDDKKPSLDWHLAADAAIGYVARLEGRPITDKEKRALEVFESREQKELFS